MPVTRSKSPVRGDRGRSSSRNESRTRSKSPKRGAPTPSARGGRSRLSVKQNELKALAFTSPGRHMTSALSFGDSPSPRKTRSQARTRHPCRTAHLSPIESASTQTTLDALTSTQTTLDALTSTNCNSASPARGRSPLRVARGSEQGQGRPTMQMQMGMQMGMGMLGHTELGEASVRSLDANEFEDGEAYGCTIL